MSEPLVVIDAQDYYICRSSAHPDSNQLIDNIAKQCRLAMGRGDPIVFVEYDSVGEPPSSSPYRRTPNTFAPTLQELTNLTNRYSHRFFVSKCDQSGGAELARFFREQKLPHSIVRVCGIWADFCVYETVKSMVGLMPNTTIRLVQNATRTSSSTPWVNKAAIDRLCRLNRVVPMGSPF